MSRPWFARLGGLILPGPMKKWSDGLVLRVAGGMLAAGVVLAMIFALISAAVISERETQRQLDRVGELLSTVESTVSIACFTGDQALAEEVMHGLLTNRLVAGVSIIAGQRVLAASVREGYESELDRAVHRQVKSPFDSMHVGEVTLVADHAYIQTLAREQVRVNVTVLLIEAMALGLLLVWIMLRVVVRPIQHLAREIDAAPAGSRTRLSLTASNAHELGRLAASFNTLLDRTANLLEAEHAMRDTLARNERQLHSLTENIPLLIGRHDRHGRFVYLNSKLEDALGVRFEDVHGLRPTEIQNLPHAEPMEGAIRRVARNGMEEEFETQMRLASGESVWLHMQILPEFDEHGLVVSILAVGRDVTARHQAERHLLETRNRLLAVLQSIPDLVWLKDESGVYQACNHTFERFFGARENEIIGKRDHDFVDRELADHFRRMDLVAIDKGGIHINEEWVTFAADGRRALLETRKVPIQDADGRIVGVLGIGRDITERKAAERQLKLLEQAINASGDAILVIAEDGRFAYVNDGASQALGYSREQLLDMGIPDVDPNAGADDFHRMMQSGMGRLRHFETMHRARDGELFPVEISATLMEFDGACFDIAVARNITERKAAERRLKLLEHAINATGDAIFVTNMKGAFVYVNDAACHSLGYSREDLLGMGVRDINPDASDELIQKVGAELLSQGRIDSFETVHRARDGHMFPVEIAKSLMAFDGAHFGISVARDITERKAAEQRFTHLATHDALTGLPNRVLLKDRLQQAIAQAQRDHDLLAVIFIDLDNFKVINDTMGHDVGDELLKQVAGRMRGSLRESDTVARLGGDEFVVLLHGGDARDVELVADKLLATLAPAYEIGARQLYSGASLGIAVYPKDGEDMEALMRNADTAMYAAKSQGRNQHRFFSAEMSAEIQEWSKLSHCLHRALRHKEFELHYQPKIDLLTGRVSGLEALIRWRHPEWGLVSPARFIPVAEKNGLINDIGLWVMDEACRQMREWLDQGVEPGRVAINLSGQQCLGSELPRQVRKVLKRHKIDGSRLEVEITESIVMSNAEESVRAFWALRDMGVTVAVDDFGTGYSSLSYIKRLPVNTLKIDKSFVDDLETDQQDQEIVRAILAMAQSLGLRVVAEGIETWEQYDLLRSAGCPEGQGYHFSKPLPARDMTELLLSSFVAG
ncbi:MAG: PAS domain S-box protein [Pseudomonadota bacterium]